MAPSAPGRFSTTTLAPGMTERISSATMRANASALPPGVSGTIRRIGLLVSKGSAALAFETGHAAASHAADTIAAAATALAQILVMLVSSFRFRCRCTSCAKDRNASASVQSIGRMWPIRATNARANARQSCGGYLAIGAATFSP